MKKIIAATLGLSLALLASTAFADGPKIGVVVKIGGIPWFNAMEAGIKEQSAKLGVQGFMVGPTSADPERRQGTGACAEKGAGRRHQGHHA